ncbi:MAG: MBL fold metallo-hydrolase, partial [Bdellovibrionales bacterium]|nr:MBL fold metallo-hydrolase [Bdellovibrionales bacterium]
PGLFFLQGKGGNLLASKGQDGLLLIDNDYTEMSEALKKALAGLGGEENVKYVINTHWHSDHTGNNVMLGKRAHIVAHDNVRARLASPQEFKFFGKTTEAMEDVGLPKLTYSKRMKIYFNGHEIELLHFPDSHTDGDTAVFFRDANLVHTGDLFFNGTFPFVDLEHGGNVLKLTESVAALSAQLDERSIIIPGHGALADNEDLSAFYQMLVETTAEVRELKRSGLTKEQAQEKGISKKWKSWGNGFINTPTWIGLVYGSL